MNTSTRQTLEVTGLIVGILGGSYALWRGLSESRVKKMKGPLEEGKPIVADETTPGLPEPWETPDINWLARVLIMEAGDIGPGDEWAAIANVAMNRAKKRGLPIKEVVANTSWPGGGPRGRLFVKAIQSNETSGKLTSTYKTKDGKKKTIKKSPPMASRRWSAAYQFAYKTLMGDISNPIGNRTHFVHPGGMPKTKQPDGTKNKSGSRIAFKGRWLPPWVLPETVGGTADNPKKVGRAVFA
jgi:hypothetical protein